MTTHLDRIDRHVQAMTLRAVGPAVDTYESGPLASLVMCRRVPSRAAAE